MAATPLFAVLFLGVFAAAASTGLFINFDDGSGVVLGFLGAITWGLMGLSAFDVYVDDAATVSEPIYPLVYLGLGLAMVVGLFALARLARVLGEQTPGTTDVDGVLDQ